MNESNMRCPNGCKGSYEIHTRKVKGVMQQDFTCLMCQTPMELVVAIVHQQPSASPVRDQQNF